VTIAGTGPFDCAYMDAGTDDGSTPSTKDYFSAGIWHGGTTDRPCMPRLRFLPSPLTRRRGANLRRHATAHALHGRLDRPFWISLRGRQAPAVPRPERAAEATEAARILGAGWREALDIPDGRVENTWENRLKVG